MDILLNWLWQGVVLAAAAAAVLRIMARADARVRLLICWTALGAVAALPAVPILLAMAPVEVTLIEADDQVVVPLTSHVVASSWILLVLWGGWIVTFGARLVIAAVRVRRARTAATPLPAARQRRLPHWSRVSRDGRLTRIVVSSRVHAAAALGVGSPVIAVAPRVVEQLRDDELDMIVLHEWAHVQRRDDIGNAVQLLARALLGWHPAAWWIDRRLHLERESAADRMAASTAGCPRAYAASLAALAGLLGGRSVLPVPGIGTTRLRRRITRVLTPPHAAPEWYARVLKVAAVLAVGTTGLSAGGLQLVTTRPADVTTSVAPAAALTVSWPDTALAPATGAEASPAAAVPRVPAPDAARTTWQRAPPTGSEQAGASVRASAPQEIVGEMAPLSDEIPLRLITRESRVPPIALPWASRHETPAVERASGITGPVSSWGAAAGGVAAGRASRRAAGAAAGFFTRFGTKVAKTF